MMKIRSFKSISNKHDVIKECISFHVNEEHNEIDHTMKIHDDIWTNLFPVLKSNEQNQIEENLEILYDFLTQFDYKITFPEMNFTQFLSLLSNNVQEIQVLAVNILLQYIFHNIENGRMFVQNHIFEFLFNQIMLFNEQTFVLFPILRALVSVDFETSLKMFQFFPSQFFIELTKNEILNQELGIFVFNLSEYELDEQLQHFTLLIISKLFPFQDPKTLQYLSHALLNLSDKDNFCFPCYSSLQFDHILIYLLENPKLHCVLPINLFLFNILPFYKELNINAKIIEAIIKYSLNPRKIKRCESSLKLLRKLLYMKILSIDKIIDTDLEIALINVFHYKKSSYSTKREISHFLMSFSLDLCFERFNHLIVCGLPQIIEFIFLSDDLTLLLLCRDVLEKFIPLFISGNTLAFLRIQLLECLKPEIIDHMLLDSGNDEVILFASNLRNLASLFSNDEISNT
ncbi:hypothetical protein TRFO_19672 [Tritrichomonas foetus]|uniref:Uncharacterized protein n=1 Tax=Tritrichomonas foetus TaxID=1144522 RepID=A0A1J4KHN4_9EUKA|nr:hypothetical protein TRFO_19672 [Tritrichomonas foetus]|eukprot:OHT10881.1 hypothetical protein TRFO_19672 [Tritrichomonas foetus]